MKQQIKNTTTSNSFGLFLFILVLALFSCKSQKEEAVSTDNALSEQETAEGWQLLFDGTNMDSWRVYREEGLRGWEIKDGEMIALGTEQTTSGKAADIISKEIYENFDLKLDWNISDKGNSGVFFNVIENDSLGTVYASGPEYQLLDETVYPTGQNDKNRSAANYDMQAPTVFNAKPAGEWNQTQITVQLPNVKHYLNGELVVEYNLWSPEWDSLRLNSKWKDYPAYGIGRSGHIALQDHGNQVRFKNIKIRKL